MWSAVDEPMTGHRARESELCVGLGTRMSNQNKPYRSRGGNGGRILEEGQQASEGWERSDQPHTKEEDMRKGGTIKRLW